MSWGVSNRIQEESESSTPEPGSLRPRHGASVLADMIRNSPPEEALETSELGDDQSDDNDFGVVTVAPAILSQPHESTPLLSGRNSSSNGQHHGSSPLPHDIESLKRSPQDQFVTFKHAIQQSTDRSRKLLQAIVTPKSWNRKTVWMEGVVRPASYLPAVLLGLLLNILDALSYGETSLSPNQTFTNECLRHDSVPTWANNICRLRPRWNLNVLRILYCIATRLQLWW